MTPRRITIITRELLGYVRTGGVGTATTFLALALARMQHRVEVMYIGQAPTLPVDHEWARLYESAGVRIQVLPRDQSFVEPPHFARMRDVELALRAERPDVVLVHDFSAPAYSALRLHHLGLDFADTLFVVYCHGTPRLAKEGRQIQMSPTALALNVLEQASIEIADVVVSPSAYLVDWMRRQRWRLPERARVIPLVTRSSALGDATPDPAPLDGNASVERIAFFGRLEERKGLRPFAAGINALAPDLLANVELEFLGKPTKGWSTEDVESLLSDSVRASLRRVSFATELDQQEVLARLSRPGTLAVIPSLVENSPNVIYECLESGIPFVASDVGGIAELVAEEDQARVLFEPTAAGVEDTLRQALSSREFLRPVRAAFDAAESLRAWADVIDAQPIRPPRRDEHPAVDVVLVHQGTRHAVERTLAALAGQSYSDFTVIAAAAGADAFAVDGLPQGSVAVRSEHASTEAAREAGLREGSAPWVVFLDEGDEPESGFLETLVTAQAASGADVVSCALRIEADDGSSTQHFFAGEPKGTGVLANGYGTVALLRRSLLGGDADRGPTARDPDWPLLAGLSASGARIVSVPVSLVTRGARPGTVERDPTDALLVLARLERALPDSLRSLARLVAGLAADAQRASAEIRRDGVGELVRRARRRALRLFSA